jgi:hypothetical protein
MRRAVCVLAIAAGLMLPAGAGATESTIFPGVGIGKVELGMTKKQVAKALGRYRFVNERDGSHLSVGWGFGEWTVDFVGDHVVQVATTLAAQRTRNGIGPGTTWRQLVRAYPGGRCGATYLGLSIAAELLVAHRGGTQTIYVLPRPRQHTAAHRTWRVTEVHVRTPFERLQEFSSSPMVKCQPYWRIADDPI